MADVRTIDQLQPGDVLLRLRIAPDLSYGSYFKELVAATTRAQNK
jgi:hypothetical protein